MTRIERLDEVVVNRIAAGEVIQRPANAVKELLENALDAGSTSVQLTIKDGGLKLIQIQDNGHGIHQDDLEIVCERFTTSKLRKYEDLNSIATFGFRGEALASISHVSHLSMVTKIKDSPCAFRTQYRDGKLIPAKPGDPAIPRPCAGNNGTQLTIEDLFYNVPNRRKAFKNTNEEYLRILEIATRYAVHCAGVGISCRKATHQAYDLQTSASSSTLDKIRQIYGNVVARELLEIHRDTAETDSLEFQLTGFISNANYSSKKMTFLLFINHRLVECSALKRVIETVYAPYLPKGSHPWLYLSLEIPANFVDVNVHPTKREVHFLRQEEVIGRIVELIQDQMQQANQSRTFTTSIIQQPLESIGVQIKRQLESEKDLNMTVVKPSVLPPSKFVRTDPKLQKIDSFFNRLGQTGVIKGESGEQQSLTQTSEVVASSFDSGRFSPNQENQRKNNVINVQSPYSTFEKKSFDTIQSGEEIGATVLPITSQVVSVCSPEFRGTPLIQEQSNSPARYTEVQLCSIAELKEDVLNEEDEGLTQLLREHILVGLIDVQLALVQFRTKLFMVNYQALSRELFYQLFLNDFHNFGELQLTTPLAIPKALELALEYANLPEEHSLDPEATIRNITELLVDKRNMLAEYFKIKLDLDCNLCTLPMCLKSYVPLMAKLPIFFLRLGIEVDWSEEKACLYGITRELALFYAVDNLKEDVSDEYKRVVECTIFPAFRSTLIVPKTFRNETDLVELVHLGELYKIFERC